jgi:hypothetical protein
MPKRAFYPAVLILFGLIEMANLMGYFPQALRDFWPVLMIIVGLGGLLTADKEGWLSNVTRPASRVTSKKAARRR